MDERLPTTQATPDPEPSGSEDRPFLRPLRNFPSFALNGLFLLAVFYTLYFARLFLLPLVLALLFALLLSPVVRGLRRLHIPEAVGAGVVMLALAGAVVGSGYLLIDPAAEWIARVPASLGRIESKLREFYKPMEQVGRATKEMEKLTQMGNDGQREVPVQVGRESIVETFLGSARTLTSTIVVLLVLLYFLLASGDLFLRKLIRILSTLEDKKRAVEIGRHLQEDISAYLLTITIINLGLGVAVGTAMSLLAMPNPLLWGAVAATLNYIPYIGAIVGVAVITLTAALTFDTAGEILLAPLVYYLLTAAEGYLITPMVVGKRMTLNPVVIILGLIFWGGIWGIVGAVLAVPLLVSFKIFCDHIPSLSPVGEFLGR